MASFVYLKIMIHEKENFRSDFNPNLSGSFLEILLVLLGYNKQYVDSKAGGITSASNPTSVALKSYNTSFLNICQLGIHKACLVSPFGQDMSSSMPSFIVFLNQQITIIYSGGTGVFYYANSGYPQFKTNGGTIQMSFYIQPLD